MVLAHPLVGVGPNMVEQRTPSSAIHLRWNRQGAPAQRADADRRRARPPGASSPGWSFVGIALVDLSRAVPRGRTPRAGRVGVGGAVVDARRRPVRVQLRRLGVPDAVLLIVLTLPFAAIATRRVSRMNLPPLARSTGPQLIARFGGLRILVVGDVMLDRFIVGTVTRISPEAPVPVVVEHEHVAAGRRRQRRAQPRGARRARVARGHRRPGRGAPSGCGRAVGRRHRRPSLVEDPGRPTTKSAHRHGAESAGRAHGLRGATREVSGDLERDRASTIGAAGGARALVVSDYLKGVVTRAVVRGADRAEGAGDAARGGPEDSAPRSTIAGATLVTPNHHEAEQATHLRNRTDDEAQAAARDFGARRAARPC